jgi:glutamate/tyrosine decarboxylase-like PLP-dependent enzyme
MTKESISRKKFFQICGTAIAGGSIAVLSGVLLHRNLTADTALKRQDCPFPNETTCSSCKANCPLTKGKTLSRL